MGNLVGRRGKSKSVLIVGRHSYVANRISDHFKNIKIKTDFLSHSGDFYTNNKVVNNLFNNKNNNSFKYSYIINCAGPDREFCLKHPLEGIKRRKQIIYKICDMLDYGLAENVLHFSSIHVFSGINSGNQIPKPFACPNDPYGFSHILAENLLIENLSQKKYEKNFTIFRLPNLFGHSKKMLGNSLGLFGNQIINMACEGLVRLKAKTNNAINLFPLGLLCKIVEKEYLESNFLGQTINLYPERPTKILDYLKKINKYTEFFLESNISDETPNYPNYISDIKYNNFDCSFDNEVYETFLFFQKKCK